MAQRDVRNKPHRSGFDLSNRVCFSNRTGYISPVKYYEVLPGDTFDIDLNAFMRTIPLNTASFARLREYYDVFFVPYSLLWDKWNSFIVQTNQPTHAASSSSGAYLGDTHPYFSYGEILQVLSSMSSVENLKRKDDGGNSLFFQMWHHLHALGYLQVPEPYEIDFGELIDFNVNPFPLLAYQKIYQDYFRLQQWEEASPWAYNLDYMLTSADRKIPAGQDGANYASNNYFTPRYCNYDKDLILGLMPSAQFGDEAQVTIPIMSPKGSLNWLGSPVPHLEFSVEPGSVEYALGLSSQNTSSPVLSNGAIPFRPRLRNVSITTGDNSSLPSRTALQAAFSVLQYRRAEARQKWAEITLSGDLDYKSQIQKHWGVTPPDSESYLCQRLGGAARNLDISEVLNTNFVDNASPEVKGRGILSQNGHIKWTNRNNQYGIIMITHHVKPIIEWSQEYVFEPILTKTTADRYAIPEFDQIGNEGVPFMTFSGHVVNPNSEESLTNTAGYAPRYYDYKTSLDIARGSFLTTNRNWILLFENDFMSPEDGRILYPFFKVRSAITDTIFAVIQGDESDTDPYLCTCYIDCKVIRNLDRDGLPY